MASGIMFRRLPKTLTVSMGMASLSQHHQLQQRAPAVASASGMGSLLSRRFNNSNGPERGVQTFHMNNPWPSSALSEYAKPLVSLELQTRGSRRFLSCIPDDDYDAIEEMIEEGGDWNYDVLEQIAEIPSGSEDSEEDQHWDSDDSEQDEDREICRIPGCQWILISTTKFCDVNGADKAKAELEDIVQYLSDPKHFTCLGSKLSKGVLLVGPPAAEKGMLAKAVAGEAGVPFFIFSVSQLNDLDVDVRATSVKKLFSVAKRRSPCIIFIDGIDASAGVRNSDDSKSRRQIINQLLVEMDGFKQNDGIIFLAETGLPRSLDKDATRPGRFDRHVEVSSPDVEDRRQILEAYMSKYTFKAEGVDLMTIARGTPGFSSGDLANLVLDAAAKAGKDGAKAVMMEHLEYSMDEIMMGSECGSAVIPDNCREMAAFHAGGRALIVIHTDGARPIYKASIVARGNTLGMVTQLREEEDVYKFSRNKMLRQLDILMGGKVAEELIFGETEVSSGALSDLREATQLATDMVTKYGMSQRIGPVCYGNNNDGKQTTTSSWQATSLVDQEVEELLVQARKNAKKIITAHRKELNVLADALLEHGTLTGDQIKQLVNGLKIGSSRQDQETASSS